MIMNNLKETSDQLDNKIDENSCDLAKKLTIKPTGNSKNFYTLENATIDYDEQKLTNLVIDTYDGEVENDLIQGIGTLKYRNGNIYKGEFYAGMMFGRGTYNWLEGDTYEGDFLNNEINGTGCYNWSNNNVYEGEVQKGKRHGFGTFRSEIGSYTGEWLNGKREGKGKILFDQDGKSYYEGDWVQDKPFGWGIRRYPTGNFYEGMWINGIRHGIGTMRWINKNQIYLGQWLNNKQHGTGEHHWYLTRVESSQYVLRNSYYGEFSNGKRHGNGTFLYANGSKYQGYWMNNLKHGFGKITLKNGKSFEVYFEKDKLISPQSPLYGFNSDSKTTENKIFAEINSDDDETNFKLDIDVIISKIPVSKQKIENTQVMKTVVRHIDVLRKIYRFYSRLGFESSPDNTYILNRMQLWRLIKDCKLHHNNFTLIKFDRLLNENSSSKQNDLHSPFDKILMREFLSALIVLSYHLNLENVSESDLKISKCFEILMRKIEEFSCNVQGYLYNDSRKTSFTLNYMLKCYEAYKLECLKKKVPTNDMTLKMRDFVEMLDDYGLINNKRLTTKDVIRILAYDDPNVQESDNSCNLELEMSFLEFFEALIGCAFKFMNGTNIHGSGTPRASTIITREQSFLSEVSVNTHNEQKLDDKATVKDDFVANNMTDNENGDNGQNKLLSSKKENIKNRESGGNRQTTADIERDNQIWFKNIETFFNTHFFPQINKYKNLEKNINLKLAN